MCENSPMEYKPNPDATRLLLVWAECAQAEAVDDYKRRFDA